MAEPAPPGKAPAGLYGDLRRESNRLDDDIISQGESFHGGSLAMRHRRSFLQRSLRHSSIYSESADRTGANCCAAVAPHADPSLAQAAPHLDEPLKRTYINHTFHHLRFLVVIFGGSMFGAALLLRYSICVAILKMVNQTAVAIKTGANVSLLEINPDESTGEFDWDNRVQQMIMSFYMFAYTLPQIPACKLGLFVGSRWSITVSTMLCCVSTILIPHAAYMGHEYVVALRMLNGLGAAGILSMVLNLVEKWMPYHQMTLGLILAETANGLMTALNPLVGGYLSSIHWSLAFYVPGGIGLLMSIAFFVVVSDAPETNWLISERELRLIKYDFPAADAAKGAAKGADKTTTIEMAAQLEPGDEQQYDGTIADVLRLPAFYAYVAIWCCYCSAWSGFHFILPLYLGNMLQISVNQTGLYTFIIGSGQLLSTIWPQLVVHAILERKCGRSPTTARRMGYLLTCSVVCLTWLSTGLWHKNQVLLLFLNRCFHGSNDVIIIGTLMSNFAKAGLSSITFSTVNMFGNLSVVGSSMLMGYLLDKTGQSSECWTWIFCALASTQIVAITLYCTMIRSEPVDFSGKRKKQKGQKGATGQHNNLSSAQQPKDNDCKRSSSGIMNNFGKSNPPQEP